MGVMGVMGIMAPTVFEWSLMFEWKRALANRLCVTTSFKNKRLAFLSSSEHVSTALKYFETKGFEADTCFKHLGR